MISSSAYVLGDTKCFNLFTEFDNSQVTQVSYELEKFHD